MAVTILSGLVDEGDILSNERVIDMSNRIDMLEPDETQFFTMLNKIGSGPAPISSKIEWLEDQLLPRLSAIGASAASGLSSLSVTASHSPYFAKGDLCRITTTGEAFEVIGVGTVSASILEVQRGIGGTTAASTASGVDIVIVGNSSVQGASLGTRRITQRTTNYNYTQILRKSYGFTETLLASLQYGGEGVGNVLDRERHKKGIEHKREIEQTLFWGARAYQSPGDSGGSEPQGFCGGLSEFVSTSKRNVAGTLSYSTLETNMRTDLQKGDTGNKVIFAAPLVAQVFSAYSITAWTRADPNQSVWGTHIDGLLNGAYGANTPVFVHKDWNDLTVAVATGGWGGQLFVVDMGAVRLRTMRPTKLLRSRQGPSEDQQVEEYLTELSLEVKTEQKHAWWYGITG